MDRPARINYFVKHTVIINNKPLGHLLFSAIWFKKHQQNNVFGKPISVWECDLFDIPSVSSIIPVHFIKCRTVSLTDVLDSNYGNALFVTPCVDF